MAPDDTGTRHDDEIIHRELDTEEEDPGIQVVEIIAELEGVDTRDLSSIWSCIDHTLDEIFSNPPAPEAQVETTFSYEGYRVTVEQDGHAKFVETA